MSHIESYGIPDTDYKHCRSSFNETFSIGNNEYILRMKPSEECDDTLFLQPKVSHLLYEYGAYVVPAKSLRVTVRDGWVSTLWYKGDPNVQPYDCIPALESIHAIDDEEFIESLDLERMDVFSHIENLYLKIHDSHIDKDILNYIENKIEEVSHYQHEISSSGDNIVHLDGYHQNIVIYDNNPCLIDLDTLSIGPWQYDYVIVYTTYLRAQEDIDLSQFPEGFMEWEYLDKAIEMRTLEMFLWCCVMGLSSPMHKKEMRNRYLSLIGEKDYAWDFSL